MITNRFVPHNYIQRIYDILQVIYDCDNDGGIAFRFFCTGLPSEQKLQKLKAIGVKL